VQKLVVYLPAAFEPFKELIPFSLTISWMMRMSCYLTLLGGINYQAKHQVHHHLLECQLLCSDKKRGRYICAFVSMQGGFMGCPSDSYLFDYLTIGTRLIIDSMLSDFVEGCWCPVNTEQPHGLILRIQSSILWRLLIRVVQNLQALNHP
jgi:hypothetical protein